MDPDRNIRVLIVDDNDLDREAVFRLIYDVYCVLEARSGNEGWRIAQESKPACVLLDYRLPDVDDFELLQRFVGAGIPVVFLTGQGSEAVAAKAIKAGAEDYLPKSSLDRAILARAVSNAIEKFDLRRRMDVQQRDVAGFVSFLSESMRQPICEITSAVEQIAASGVNLLGSTESVLLALEQLSESVDAMREYVRIGEIGVEDDVADLDACLEDVLSGLRSDPELGDVELQCGRMPIVTGNVQALSGVLENAIRAAIKTAAEAPPRILIKSDLEDDIWTITVANREDEAIDSKRTGRQSWSIGGPSLVVAASVVKQHGGDTWAQSDSRGAWIRFTLPHHGHY